MFDVYIGSERKELETEAPQAAFEESHIRHGDSATLQQSTALPSDYPNIKNRTGILATYTPPFNSITFAVTAGS